MRYKLKATCTNCRTSSNAGCTLVIKDDIALDIKNELQYYDRKLRGCPLDYVANWAFTLVEEE